MRVGFGYDVHRLIEGRDLILGGVKIPYEKGLLGHSDADVIVHAVMDALLGAAALGDIGRHFPDTDPQYLGISSIELLKKVGELLEDHHFWIENIDATIIAQKPKMAPHIPQMIEHIAQALKIETDRVNVKATTEEGSLLFEFFKRVNCARYDEFLFRLFKGVLPKMKIEKLSKDERQKTRPLYEEVFAEDTKEFVDYYYKNKAPFNEIFAAVEGDQICGMAHLNPYVLSIDKKEVQGAYLVAVATKKELRHRGIMTSLLKEIFKFLYEKEYPFLYLMPASELIYKPFDFRFFYSQKEKTHQVGDKRKSGSAQKKFTLREVGREDLYVLSHTLNEILKKQNNSLSGRFRQRIERNERKDDRNLAWYRMCWKFSTDTGKWHDDDRAIAQRRVSK